MRPAFNRITLFASVTTVALVSSAVSARGPAAPKPRNPASANQPTEKPPSDKPAESVSNSGNGVANRPFNNTANGKGNVRTDNVLPTSAGAFTRRYRAEGSNSRSNGSSRRGGSITILNSGYGSMPGRINGLPVLDHPLHHRHKPEPGRINGLPIVEHQTGAGSPSSGVPPKRDYPVAGPIPPKRDYPVAGPIPPKRDYPVAGPIPPKRDYPVGEAPTAGIPPHRDYPVGVAPPLGGPYRDYPVGSGGANGGATPNPPPKHHPNPPPNGNGFPVVTGVSYYGGSSPVTAAAPAADSTAAASANDAAAGDAANLTNVPAGATIKLDGSDFGAQPGRVTIVAGNMILPADVVSWTEKSVSLTLPQVEMTAPMQAKFVVHRANGSAAMETPFQLSDRAK
jgi:hypothetical protein